jgi:Rrf2 family protein
MNMARRGGDCPMAARDIVKGERYSLTFTEKILQRLKAARIVISQQGNGGGYVLARSASEITLKEIIEALEGQTFEVFCQPKVRKEISCRHTTLCDVSSIWYKTKELLDGFYGSITLQMVANREINFRSSDIVFSKPAGRQGAEVRP